jgi:hypothetical protein
MAPRQQGNCSTLDSMRGESICLSLARTQASALDSHYFLWAGSRGEFPRTWRRLARGRARHPANRVKNQSQDSLEPFEFRHNHSERSGGTGHASQRISVDVCDCQTVTQIKRCPFLHGSSFPRCLRYRLGLLAVDPKLGEKKWRLQNASKCARLFVRAEAIESFGDTGPRNRAS